jgi:hypothetical protein
MKRILISNDGFPGDNDAWRYIQSAYTEMGDALLAALGVPDTGNYILSGVVGGASASKTAGWISINGVIMKSVAGNGNHLLIGANKISVTFEDTVVREAYVDSFITPTSSAITNLTIPYADFIRLGTDVVDYVPTSTNHTMTGGSKLKNGRVQLTGQVTRALNTSIAAPVLIFTLALGFRPPIDRMFQVCRHSLSVDPEMRTIQIKSNGEVYVYNLFQAGESLPLDTISYNI